MSVKEKGRKFEQHTEEQGGLLEDGDGVYYKRELKGHEEG